MSFFVKTTYSNLFNQKFSKSLNLISNNLLFEIKFKDLEDLGDDSISRTFYFFYLIFGKIPSLKNFKSKYHLGKTLYNFSIFLTIKTTNSIMGLDYFFEVHYNEPQKNNLNPWMGANRCGVRVDDLKLFFLVDSNPHFFKWDKELNITCLQFNFNLLNEKNLNIYFWNVNNLKTQQFNNLWSYYVI